MTSPFFSVDKKVAVITGGGSGIGLATARRLAAAGAHVTIANRRDSSGVAAEIGATYIPTDVAVEEQVERLMAAVAERHGRIDIIVNNAAYADAGGSVEDISSDAMRRYVDVNLLGVFYGMKYGSPHMLDGGSIINIGSLAALVGYPGYGAYVSTKWAVVGLTKSAAIELGPRRIRVNCVCPGTTDTPINQEVGAEAELKLVRIAAPLGRIGEPEDIAAVIHFLASNDASYVSGSVITADGGWLAGPSHAAIEKLIGA